MEPAPDYFLKWQQAEAEIERLEQEINRLNQLLNPKREESE